MKKKSAAKPKATVLILRTCDANLKSHGGFQWPKSGPVQCSDWKPTPTCGNGLHGLLWGEGGGSLLNWAEDAKWLVVEVEAASVVVIDSQKVKFPAGIVVHCGDRLSATEYIKKFAPHGKTIVGITATAGYGGTATAGYGGTATAGDGGTATAGDKGTATAGDKGTATAGYRGTATAGYGGILCMAYWDEKANRYRKAIGYVGENGIEANTAYEVEDGKLKKKGGAA